MFRIYRKNIKRMPFISRAEKIALLKAIEKKPVLWDIKNHKNIDNQEIKNAWKAISSEVRMEVNLCKSTWDLLKASLEHYIKRAAAKSPGQESVLKDVEWDLAKHMTFLLGFTGKTSPTPSVELNPEFSPLWSSVENRSTPPRESRVDDFIVLSSDDDEESQSSTSTDHANAIQCDMEDANSGPENNYQKNNDISEDRNVSDLSPNSNYQPGVKRRYPNYDKSLTNADMESVSCSVKQSDNIIPMPKLKHYDMYLFWDHILDGMPKETLNEVRFKVTALLQDIVKEQTPQYID